MYARRRSAQRGTESPSRNRADPGAPERNKKKKEPPHRWLFSHPSPTKKLLFAFLVFVETKAVGFPHTIQHCVYGNRDSPVAQRRVTRGPPLEPASHAR